VAAYFYGMGLGLPNISLITTIVQFNTVRSKGTTGYDRGRYVMSEAPLGLGRRIAAFSVAIVILVLIVAVNVVGK
jgi:hypothetical protein